LAKTGNPKFPETGGLELNRVVEMIGQNGKFWEVLGSRHCPTLAGAMVCFGQNGESWGIPGNCDCSPCWYRLSKNRQEERMVSP
jgi:hypothetical protein